MRYTDLYLDITDNIRIPNFIDTNNKVGIYMGF